MKETKKEKFIVNCTKIKGGFRCSARFTYLTVHHEFGNEALKLFVQKLKLRNYEVLYKL